MSHANENCTKIRQQLALYAGRDLEEPLCVEVEQHLGECASCRAELARAGAARERIAVLGAQTARGLESVDLWPALGERWTRERVAAKPAAAAAIAGAPRAKSGTWRRWVPLSLAAAAALAVALRWNSEPAAPTTPPFSHIVDPALPPEDVASNLKADESLQSGALRRAAPGEERLRDSSSPLRPWPGRGSQDTPNSLAGDKDLR